MGKCSNCGQGTGIAGGGARVCYLNESGECDTKGCNKCFNKCPDCGHMFCSDHILPSKHHCKKDDGEEEEDDGEEKPVTFAGKNREYAVLDTDAFETRTDVLDGVVKLERDGYVFVEKYGSENEWVFKKTN